MTRIIEPFAEIGSRKKAEVLNQEYIQQLSDLLATKFQGAQVSPTNSGIIYIEGRVNENIRYNFSVILNVDTNSMVNATVNGAVHGSVLYPARFQQPQSDGAHQGEIVSTPISFGKDVFQEDNINVLADFIYTNVNRLIGSTNRRFLEKTKIGAKK